jgi:hypothetical protein
MAKHIITVTVKPSFCTCEHVETLAVPDTWEVMTTSQQQKFVDQYIDEVVANNVASWGEVIEKGSGK